MVDEGQDFSPAWWEIITSFLKRNGEEEAYFISDDTQDIYGVSKSWVGKMEGAGFRGPWNELHTYYRIPQDFIPKIKNFIEFLLKFFDEPNLIFSPFMISYAKLSP